MMASIFDNLAKEFLATTEISREPEHTGPMAGLARGLQGAAQGFAAGQAPYVEASRQRALLPVQAELAGQQAMAQRNIQEHVTGQWETNPFTADLAARSGNELYEAWGKRAQQAFQAGDPSLISQVRKERLTRIPKLSDLQYLVQDTERIGKMLMAGQKGQRKPHEQEVYNELLKNLIKQAESIERGDGQMAKIQSSTVRGDMGKMLRTMTNNINPDSGSAPGHVSTLFNAALDEMNDVFQKGGQAAIEDKKAEMLSQVGRAVQYREKAAEILKDNGLEQGSLEQAWNKVKSVAGKIPLLGPAFVSKDKNLNPGQQKAVQDAVNLRTLELMRGYATAGEVAHYAKGGYADTFFKSAAAPIAMDILKRDVFIGPDGRPTGKWWAAFNPGFSPVSFVNSVESLASKMADEKAPEFDKNLRSEMTNSFLKSQGMSELLPAWMWRNPENFGKNFNDKIKTDEILRSLKRDADRYATPEQMERTKLSLEDKLKLAYFKEAQLGGSNIISSKNSAKLFVPWKQYIARLEAQYK